MKACMTLHLKKFGIFYGTGLLSALLFILIYGTAILNPSYTDWLMAGGDLSQHFLGFALYADAPWQLQIGMMNTAAYPFSESVIFTDSIPLAAVIGKLFAPLCSESFQYFGIWGILCFTLQGVLSCFLLKKYTNKTALLLPASLLFVLSPILLRRMFWHTSLASHFLILIALILIVYQKDYFLNIRRACITWGMLGALCVFVHIYFLAICGILLVCFMLCYLLETSLIPFRKRIFYTLLPLSFYACASVFSIWMLGGFSSGMDDGAPGLGYYSFNFNGFFNPQDWSGLLQNFPLYADGQYEGFAYLGLGGILLLMTALFLSLLAIYPALERPRQLFKNFGALIGAHKRWVVYTVTFLLILLAAGSNELSLGSKLLVKLTLPETLLSLWDVFRSSGRLIWPAVYMLLLFGMIVCIRKLPSRAVVLLLITCLSLQLIDLKDMLSEKRQEFASVKTFDSCLSDTFWRDILNKRNLSHIVFYDKENLSQEQLYAFTWYAVQNDLTINDFYFARALSYPVKAVAEDFYAHPDDHTLYIMTYDSYEAYQHYDLSYYTFDGFIIGLKTSI
ncbi:MAG: DUF6311 domain-containing protein [Lachnospiraceae bacterium]